MKNWFNEIGSWGLVSNGTANRVKTLSFCTYLHALRPSNKDLNKKANS